MDRILGGDFRIVEARDEAEWPLERGDWAAGGRRKEGIPEIYGTPTRKVERLVFVPEGSILRPREDPSLTLYLKRGDDHPFQAQTLYYLGVVAAIGGVLVGIALLLLGRRRAKPAPPA